MKPIYVNPINLDTKKMNLRREIFEMLIIVIILQVKSMII
jgi:hypothetical protein